MNATASRLGIYCPGNGTGGPWRYVNSILAGLDPAEFAVTLFCDLPGVYEPRPWVQVVRLDGKPTFLGGSADTGSQPAESKPRRSLARLAPGSLRLWAGFARNARRLARLLRKHPVDLFHTQNTGCEESPVAARLAGIPHVLGTFHVDSTYDLGQRSSFRYRALEYLSNHCLDLGIAYSHNTKRDWQRRTRLSPNRVLYIRNGLDFNQFHRMHSVEEARNRLHLPHDDIVLGGVGRLEHHKGFEYLLYAVALLQPNYPRLRLVIAGTGPLQQTLEALARTLGIADRVHFLGFCQDVQMVYDAIDIFVLPSLCETQGFAFLEAMATAVPTIGTTIGGIPEVIDDGTTGLLVPPRNPDRLAEAIRILLKDVDLRTRMGTAGRERVLRDFQEQEMVRKTIQVYRAMMSRNFTRPPASENRDLTRT